MSSHPVNEVTLLIKVTLLQYFTIIPSLMKLIVELYDKVPGEYQAYGISTSTL
jgi:hypothetical protein